MDNSLAAKFQGRDIPALTGIRNWAKSSSLTPPSQTGGASRALDAGRKN